VVVDRGSNEERAERGDRYPQRRQQRQKHEQVDDRRQPADEDVEEELNDPRGLVQVVFQDAIQRSKAVLGSDLLAFSVGTPSIGNTHLVDAKAHVRNFRHDFRLETEAVFFDRNRLNHLSTEYLITGLHIRQIQVREHVGQQSQKAIAHGVPKIK